VNPVLLERDALPPPPTPFSDPTHMHTCTRLVRRNRSSLLLRHQGSNAYTDTQEVVEHILRCVPTASDTTARRALLFFHTLGFLYARELCAPPGCVNHTLQLHPQFPARVLRWSRVRVHKDIPRPPNGELALARSPLPAAQSCMWTMMWCSRRRSSHCGGVCCEVWMWVCKCVL
jgi:hypothetical protein